MCTEKTVQVAHLVATVSTRVSPQTKIYGTKFASDLISLLEMRINSRKARNVFAAMVNGTRNKKF